MSNRLLRSLRQLTPQLAEDADALLLDRFVRLRDEAAFDAIVRRHGGMVFGVCRRRLTRLHDAEDAFQAVFLVLARDAGRIGSRESLPGWLYRVALLTALKLMGRNARRRTAPLPDDGPIASNDHESDVERRELRTILEDELARLPDRLRGAVVLCYLEGRSNSEAAALLGCPRGTIDSRLAAARKKLLGRLLRRGVAPASGVTAIESILRGNAAAAPAINGLLEKTLHLALCQAGNAIIAPDHVLSLVDEVTTAMSLKNLSLFAVLTVTLTLVGGGIGVYYATADGKSPDVVAKKGDPSVAVKGDAKPAPTAEKKVDDKANSKTSGQVQKLLGERVKLDNVQPEITLRDLLQYLSEAYDVPIRIDSAAFARMQVPGANKLYEQPVKLPVTRGMNLADVLREALAQLPSEAGLGEGMPATYRIRDGQILIVPAYIPPYATGVPGSPENATRLPISLMTEQEEGEPISLAIEDKPLTEALQELRRITGANIVLDNREHESARMPVSATFNDVRLLTALRVLGDMCDLKPVAMNNVYYVTSRDNAIRLQKELNRERFGEPMVPEPIPAAVEPRELKAKVDPMPKPK